jgi:hypothetical protein
VGNIINLDNYEIDEDAFSVVYLMQGVLDRVVAIYESYGVPLPSRRYWTMGQPATDCEQVVVSFIQMYLGAPGDEAAAPQRCNVPRSAVLQVAISREIPVVGQSGRAPSAEKIQDGSKISAVDSWILMAAVNLFDQWEEGGYGPGVIATLNSEEPQGGFQNITLQLTMAVP